MQKLWGILPSEIRQTVLQRYWKNEKNLKACLLGQKAFPICISLKPPSSKEIIKDVNYFQTFINAWQLFTPKNLVEWETRSYRILSQQTIPKSFIIKNIQTLFEFIGSEAIERSQKLQTRMHPLLTINKEFYSILINHLNIIERLSLSESELLASILKQLTPNMGNKCYLRALPLKGIDTKFLEKYKSLVTALLDKQYQGEITAKGDLLTWLGCEENPKGWLFIRCLDPKLTQIMGGFSIMQLSATQLQHYPLPSNNILVVENVQSGLGLPELKDTIAVFGGGKNITWMDATWLKDKKVGYWGDIDSWGLSILSDARSKLPLLESIMMDHQTIELHKDRMVMEKRSLTICPINITTEEKLIFTKLSNQSYPGSRLEQERLSADYIYLKLHNWLDS